MFNVQQGWKRSSLFSKVGGDVHCSVGLKEKLTIQQGLEKRCLLFSITGGEDMFNVQQSWR